MQNPARYIRGRGELVILVLFLLVLYNYELILRGSQYKLLRPAARVEDAPDAVKYHTVADVVEPAKLQKPTSTVSQSPQESTPVQEDDGKEKTQGYAQGDGQSYLLTPDDILLIVKTGASTIWRRMPLHLITTLSDNKIPHAVIYSDLTEKLSNGFEAIDAIQNVTSVIQAFDPDAYNSYLELQSSDHVNTYHEHGRLPGDEPPDTQANNTPGWLLDKYKFLPMLAHAQRNFPAKKWYIYIEDDTYVFLPTLLSWLSSQSYNTTPTYFGASSGVGNETFAQGGSGVVFSQALMQAVFSEEKEEVADLEKYGNYTSTACCGDVALGKVLRDYDIYVNEGAYGSVSFRPEPPWKTGFKELIWCSPLFTFHHLHQKDIAILARLEEDKHLLNASRPVLFRDIFISLINPHLSPTPRKSWDNFASQYTFTNASIPPSLLSANTTAPVPILPPNSSTLLTQAFQTPEHCLKACLALVSCLSWKHEVLDEQMRGGIALKEERRCAIDTLVRLGRELDPFLEWERTREVVSGWVMDRIGERLVSDECVDVGSAVV